MSETKQDNKNEKGLHVASPNTERPYNYTMHSEVIKKVAAEAKVWGQPTKYREEYCDLLVQFFEDRRVRTREVVETRFSKGGEPYEVVTEKANPPPTLFGFAALVGVDMGALARWAKKYPEFKKAYNIAKNIQGEFVMSNAMVGLAPSNFASLVMKNCHGWVDKSQQELTHKTSLENLIRETYTEEDN